MQKTITPTPHTLEQYKQHNATRCPRCNSAHTDGGSLNFEADWVTHERSCSSCNSTWQDSFTLETFLMRGDPPVEASLTDEQYLAANGGVCPTCKSDEVDAGESTFVDGGVNQECSCDGCEAQWTEFYELKNYRLAPRLSTKEFAEAEAELCPMCGSDQTEGDSVEINGRHGTYQECSCLNCEATWNTYYTRTHYRITSSS